MSEKLVIDFLAPWSLPQIAQLHTLAMEMASWGLSAEEVMEICQTRLEAERSETVPSPSQPLRHKPPVHRCPECGARLAISAVNVSRCTNIGGPWKSSLFCNNRDCRYTSLSEKSIQEWRSR